MKRISIFIVTISIALVTFGFYACNRDKQLTEDVKISADNPNNPYDFLGQYHNEVIQTLIKADNTRGESGQLMLPSVREFYKVCRQLLVRDGLITMTRSDGGELTDEQLSDIEKETSDFLSETENGYIDYISNSDLGEATKQQLISLFSDIQNLEDVSYNEVMQYIIDFQNDYIASLPTTRSEQELTIDDIAVLGSVSTLAHSVELWSDISILEEFGILDELDLCDIDINDPQYAGWWKRLWTWVKNVARADAYGFIGGIVGVAISFPTLSTLITGGILIGATYSFGVALPTFK